MEIVPALNVMRFAQASPGDLLIVPMGDDSTIAIVAEDPTQNGQRYLVALGPVFPGGAGRPSLVSPPGMTVVSLSKSYVLRLPVSCHGWSDSPPPPETIGIFVSSSGVYFRVDAGPAPSLLYCYVEIATGRIHVSGTGVHEQYATPPGIHAFAVEWEFVTDEHETRSILKYPALPRHDTGVMQTP
jgi:hypothetical protein